MIAGPSHPLVPLNQGTGVCHHKHEIEPVQSITAGHRCKDSLTGEEHARGVGLMEMKKNSNLLGVVAFQTSWKPPTFSKTLGNFSTRP